MNHNTPEVYRVQHTGTFNTVYETNDRAAAVKYANNLANIGQNAIVWAGYAQMIIYRNWTGNALYRSAMDHCRMLAR